MVVRAWIDEQNKINNLLSINNQTKLKPKPNYGKILRIGYIISCMGRDLYLHTESTNKKSLSDHIKSYGKINTTSHLLNWPKGSEHLLWFNQEDFKSITGVEITIFPEIRGKRKFWSLHVRNTYSASWHDVSMMNKILTDSKKKFGGTIDGDYGKNKVAPLWEDDTSPMSRGIDYITRNTSSSIQMLEVSLPQPWNNFQTVQKSKSTDKKIEDFLAYTDPTRQIYIGLIPMLVAIFEFYFKETFRVLASYDEGILSKIMQTSSDNKNLDTPEIISSFINNVKFQNFKNVRKIYKRHADLDIKSIIEESTSIENYNKLKELINFRHDIVHRLESDWVFTREDFLEFHKVLKESLLSITCNIITKYDLNTKEIYLDI